MIKKIAGVAVVSALVASMSGCFYSLTDGQALASKTTSVGLVAFSPVQGSAAIFTCENNGVTYVLQGGTANTLINAANWAYPLYYNSAQYNKALPAGCWKKNATSNTAVLKLLTTASDGAFVPQYTYNNAGKVCLNNSAFYSFESGGKYNFVLRGVYCQTGTAVNLSAPL